MLPTSSRWCWRRLGCSRKASAKQYATELSAYCRERGLFPEQVSRWRQAAQDANAKPVLTMAEQKELEKLRAQDQREIKALRKELQRKEKAMAEMAALLVLQKKWDAFCSEDAEG